MSNLRDIIKEDAATRASRLVSDIGRQSRALKTRQTLVNTSLTNAIPFASGYLYLFGALSGHGKSTLAANASCALIAEQKKVLVISNEEPEFHVLARVACLNLNFDFNAWRKDKVSQIEKDAIQAEILRVADYMTVVDATKADTTCLEDVMEILRGIKFTNYSLVVIDYFQKIGHSKDEPRLSKVEVLTKFQDFIGPFTKSAPCPILLLVQLYSTKRVKGQIDMADRIKWCTGIIEPVDAAIEIIKQIGEGGKPDQTLFMIAKDRFGYEGATIPCKFVRGHYLDYTVEEITRMSQDGAPEPKSDAKNESRGP